MWRIHRYYLKELLFNFGLTFVLLFGVCLLGLAARGIYRSQGADMILALWITLLWGIDSIHHLLPISLLVATVFTFGRASSENEVTALRSAGVSPLRLMGAVLISGAAVTVLNSWLLHNLVPLAHYQKYRPAKTLLEQFILNNRPTANRLEFSSLSMSWEKKEGNCYRKVVFKIRGRRGRRVGFAERACFGSKRQGEVLLVRLLNVEGFLVARGEGGRQTRFREGEIDLSFDLRDLLEQNKRREGVKDLSTAQLWAEVSRGRVPRLKENLWRIWRRSTQALAGLLLALAGFPIGILSKRSGRMTAFAFSFLPLALYYGLSYLSPPLARSLGAVWPVFLPAAGMLVFSWLLGRWAFRR